MEFKQEFRLEEFYNESGAMYGFVHPIFISNFSRFLQDGESNQINEFVKFTDSEFDDSMLIAIPEEFQKPVFCGDFTICGYMFPDKRIVFGDVMSVIDRILIQKAYFVEEKPMVETLDEFIEQYRCKEDFLPEGCWISEFQL